MAYRLLRIRSPSTCSLLKIFFLLSLIFSYAHITCAQVTNPTQITNEAGQVVEPVVETQSDFCHRHCRGYDKNNFEGEHIIIKRQAADPTVANCCCEEEFYVCPETGGSWRMSATVVGTLTIVLNALLA